MVAHDLKAAARRFAEEHIGPDYVAVHDELLAPNPSIHFHAPGVPDPLDSAGHQAVVAGFRAALPDIRVVAEDAMQEGNRVAVRWSGSGTHLGEFQTPMGAVPPTGKRATCTGIYIFHFDDQGKIVEFWENFDLMGFLQQIGAFPAPAEATA